MDPRVIEILSKASATQKSYVETRLLQDNPSKAAQAMGIHRSTPHKWDNFDELEEAVDLLRMDRLEATRMALESELLAAVEALSYEIRKHGTGAVAAARAILDRAGFPAQSAVDVTSGGEPIKATIYIPDNGRDGD